MRRNKYVSFTAAAFAAVLLSINMTGTAAAAGMAAAAGISVPAGTSSVAGNSAPSVDLTGQMRYFADPGKNGPAEKSFPLYLPEAGSIALNYWSNYFTEETPEKNVSHIRITDANGRQVFSRDRIEKGDKVFDLALGSGQYEITVGSGTADGRIAFEVLFTPGSAAGSFQGELRAGELADDAGGRVLSLSGDASLYLDTDLTVERLEALGGADRTLTVTGPGELTIRTPSLRAEQVLLNISSGTVTAPELGGFLQTGGTVRITGGAADSFRIYGGELIVESDGDGLTGPFEIHGGNVQVNAAGCGIFFSGSGGAPIVTGGNVLVRGGRRAALIERTREEGQGASDNLGYRLVREEIPLFIAENVAVVRPAEGWTRVSGREYLFPESVRELQLSGRGSASPVKD